MTPVNDDMANAVLGYKSPIELYMDEIKIKVEGDCVKAAQEYGFKVDKYELAKALKYDRDQYNAGYLDGYMEARRKFERPQGEWKLDSVGAYCSECKVHPDYTSNFCPNCGADMRKEAQHDIDKQGTTR